MEKKSKHLEFIQNIISRMAGNSFLIRGWTVTLVSALFALSAKDTNNKYSIIAYVPVFFFWSLDGYYLWKERIYRALYDEVAEKKDEDINFSLNATTFSKDKNTWARSIFSLTNCILYIPLIILMIIVMFLIETIR